jgi:hypothetical protein
MATEEQVQSVVRQIMDEELPRVRLVLRVVEGLTPATRRWLIARMSADYINGKHIDGSSPSVADGGPTESDFS